ncbi:hypothetical protein WME90_40220 [Sorangium sp. So ce375]|uniref:hypothetical protein n=1 Tax=Sorangium sp. So ce375 TaxID=3133306 RepID=UPI003F5B2CF2
MTCVLRDGLRIGCAAAVVLAAAPAAAMQPPPGISPAPDAPQGGPAGALPAPAPGDAAAVPLPPPAPGDGSAPPTGVALPGAPQAPLAWTMSPDPWKRGSAPVDEQAEPKRVWYGWQHLLALGGSVVLTPIAVATENAALGWMAASPFALGGPVTHWANGHVGMGFASLGLNAGCTIGGGMAGVLVGSSSDFARDGEILGMIIGGTLGALTANVVDIAFLEDEERGPTPAESYDYVRLRPLRLRLAPHVAVAPGLTTFGLGGAF